MLFTYNSWYGVTRPDRPQLTRDQLFFDGPVTACSAEARPNSSLRLPTIMSNQMHGDLAKGCILIYATHRSLHFSAARSTVRYSDVGTRFFEFVLRFVVCESVRFGLPEMVNEV